jgi:hypothetical protein
MAAGKFSFANYRRGNDRYDRNRYDHNSHNDYNRYRGSRDHR